MGGNRRFRSNERDSGTLRGIVKDITKENSRKVSKKPKKKISLAELLAKRDKPIKKKVVKNRDFRSQEKHFKGPGCLSPRNFRGSRKETSKSKKLKDKPIAIHKTYRKPKTKNT